MDGEEPLPLAGLRVIDVGTRIGAPFCAGLLGEMGAEVIKVEDPRGGDFMRTIGPFVTAGAAAGDGRDARADGGGVGPTATRCGGRSKGGAARGSRSTCDDRGPGALPASGGARRRGLRELPARDHGGMAHRTRRLRPAARLGPHQRLRSGRPVLGPRRDSTGWASPTAACST